MNYYKEFLVSAEPFNSEILSSILWELDIQGINEEVGCLKLFAAEDSPLNRESVSAQLDKLVREKMIQSYSVEENIYEIKNWNEDWEKSLPVIVVDDKIVIKPTFREYTPKEGNIVIEIDPKMSFGTGDHQTTKLVLQLMLKYLKEGDKVLDAGSGTGILSIAAVKLGALSAVAFDNDEWSYNNGTENASLNSAAGKIKFYLSEITGIKENNFDMVFANIQKNILLSISEEIFKRVKPGGIVILSGLLFQDEKDILDKYAACGFSLVEKRDMDEWIALTFKKL